MSKLALAFVVVAVPALAAVPVVERGKFLFAHAWTPFDPESRGGDGVGPTYNASSCVECHNQGGAGGAGAQNVVSLDGHVQHVHNEPFDAAVLHVRIRERSAVRLVRSTETGADARAADAVLRANQVPIGSCLKRALPVASGEPRVVNVAFAIEPDGTVSDVVVDDSSIRPRAVVACLSEKFAALRFAKPSAPGKATAGAAVILVVRTETIGQPVTTARNTPALFGDGLIEAIPDDVIAAAASTSIAHHPEIHGVVGRTPEGRVARFGWKDDTPDLFTFVSRACSNEVGLEVPGVPQPGKRSPGYDLDLDDVTALTDFVRALPRPIEQPRSSFASEGAELFDSIGCTACHRESLGDVDGIFSDLLLHDMGSMLDDVANTGSYGGAPATATSRMWRTTPLWGVRDSGPWLHDGRAKTLREAIAVHFGEASRVREQFDWLNADGRDAIIAFLESLQAPSSTANAAE